MKKEEAKEFYPILQAYAEGKVIECRTGSEEGTPESTARFHA